MTKPTLTTFNDIADSMSWDDEQTTTVKPRLVI